MASTPTRWGICCAGLITNDFCASIKLLSPEEHVIAAIASRDKSRAQEYADRFGIPRVYDSYEDLANDENVDVVYIGAATKVHLKLCKLFINNYKPTVCEYPIAINATQAKEIIELAQEKKVFFLEAYTSIFMPIFRMIPSLLPEIGDHYVGLASARYHGDGAALVCGHYAMLPYFNILFGGKPEKIYAHAVDMPGGGDGTTAIILHYKNNCVAHISVSLTSQLPISLCISGSKGCIEFPTDLMYFDKIRVNGKEIHKPFPECPFKQNLPGSQCLIYEIKAVRECLLKGLTECADFPHQLSIDCMEIMDEIHKQIGFIRKEDD